MDIGFTENGALRYEGDIPLILLSMLKAHGWKGETFSCERKLFSAIKIHRAEKGFDAEVRKIIALLEEADRERCSMAVVVSDVRIKNLKDLQRQLRRAEKRLSDQGIISFIIGFAVHEIEAWILADDRARDAGLVEGLPYQYSGKPEDDPDPKSSLSRLIGEAIARDGRERHELETRKVMIESLRPKEVSRLCPLGFAPFNKKVDKKFIPKFVKKERK